MLDPETFDKCFTLAKTYWPRAMKVKEWEAQKPIYYQELKMFTEAQLTEALGRLIATNEYFPDIREIRNEIAKGQTAKPQVARDESLWLEGEHYLDSSFGVKYTKGQDLPAWAVDAIKDAIQKGARVARATQRSGDPVEAQTAARLLWRKYYLEHING